MIECRHTNSPIDEPKRVNGSSRHLVRDEILAIAQLSIRVADSPVIVGDFRSNPLQPYGVHTGGYPIAIAIRNFMIFTDTSGKSGD